MSLVERVDEWALMEDVLANSAERPSRVVLIRGPVATGKSELLNSVADEAEARGLTVLKATGLRAERRTPMAVFGQLLLHADQMAEQDTGTTARVARLLDDAKFTAMLRDADNEREEHVRAHVMRSLTLALRGLARGGPLAVLVDDVQYADIPSLQCLQYAMRELRAKPVVIVLGLRTGPHAERPMFSAELLRHPRLTQLRLTTLGETGTEELLRAHLDEAQAHALAPDVHRLSGGNPLLVRALIHDLLAHGPLDHDHRAPVQGADSTLPAGRTVPAGDAYRQSVLSCLHRGADAVLAVARGLAVLDDAASDATLADLLGLDRETVARALRTLAAAGLTDGGAFRHPLARTAVLDDLSREDRVGLHRRAAALLRRHGAEPPVVARHIVATGEVEGAESLDVLWETATRARRDEDVSLAIACLHLADESCPRGERRSEILAELARLAWRVRPSTLGPHLGALRAAFDEGWLAEQAVPVLISGLLWQGRFDEAAEVARKGQVAYEGASAVSGYLASGSVRTTYPTLRERIGAENWPAPHSTWDVLTTPGCDPRGRVGAALNAVLSRGVDPHAADLAETVLQGTRLSDATLETLTAALSVLIYCDRLGRAAHWCDALLREATRLGGPGWQAPLSAVRATIALRQGNAPDAVRYALTALSWISPQGWGVGIGSILATLVSAHTAMGQYEQAMSYLDHHLPEGLPETRYGLELSYARGQLYAAMGRVRPALDDFLTCGELMTRWGIDQPALVPWRSAAAEMHLRTGGEAEADRLVREQLAKCGPGQSRTRAQTLRVLAEVSGLRRHHHALHEAIEELEKCEDRLELVRALGALSRSHHALGDLGQARMMARRAWRIARDARAEALCEQLLPYGDGEAGAAERPARDGEVCPAEELTDAERRVASLASFGHSNREIARKLFITVSTVEQHLTRVYRKLNVSRRKDLPHDLLADTAC
ncbi:helix-turn-helix transcriptional regulator [Streptomyces spectabilis]|uniref:LuxR family transcriptional regulator n=1 Tax=Streptomyces spectabilis TaxID=68270 RepID=A0A5P2XEE6_STRST|nr:LuxR family transcriptional regulator [Streptomyces spectabilis]QEV63263.1 LuxR family transcriptional regulator [Streptomyces spectabilis]